MYMAYLFWRLLVLAARPLFENSAKPSWSRINRSRKSLLVIRSLLSTRKFYSWVLTLSGKSLLPVYSSASGFIGSANTGSGCLACFCFLGTRIGAGSS